MQRATLPLVGHQRIVSLDLLRGIVMVLMALDHVRDFFYHGMFGSDPMDLATTTVPLFFTRWVTHFCAPVFVFLAGTSAYLGRSRRGARGLSRLLWTRGLWLILVEVVVVRFGWQFEPGFGFIFLQVIWAIGVGMLVLAALVHLPRGVVLGIGLSIMLLHPLLYPIQMEGARAPAVLFYALHQGGFVELCGAVGIFFAYPVLPWIGVMAAGYGMGILYTPITPPEIRRRWLLWSGLAIIALFLAVRGWNHYGDPQRWSMQEGPLFTALSFLDCSKYPPSLPYLAMTLGPALLFLAWADDRKLVVSSVLVVFGRVPFFFYILHIYLIHALAVMALVLTGHAWRMGIITPAVLEDPAYADTGFDLWVVYLIWVGVVAILYLPCTWFAAYRSRHGGEAWLSYL